MWNSTIGDTADLIGRKGLMVGPECATPISKNGRQYLGQRVLHHFRANESMTVSSWNQTWCKSSLSKDIPARIPAKCALKNITTYPWTHMPDNITRHHWPIFKLQLLQKREKKEKGYICTRRYLEWHRLQVIYSWKPLHWQRNSGFSLTLKQWYIGIRLLNICNSTIATGESMEICFIIFVSFFQGAQCFASGVIRISPEPTIFV